MGRVSKFQSPGVTRLVLADGDWIEVRNRLSGGESRRVSASAFTDIQQTQDKEKPKIGVDFAQLSMGRTKAYLHDWSFRDDNDKPVKVTHEAIESLTEEVLKEIEVLLDKHIEDMDAAAKAQSGVTTSPQD